MIRLFRLLVAGAMALGLATQAQAAWVPGADGQPNVVGSTLTQTGTDGSGNPIYSGSQGTPGFDVILNPGLMQSQWAPYQVTPPLTRTWSGDDAAAPTQTVQLQFPDAATAKSVLAGLWVDDATP